MEYSFLCLQILTSLSMSSFALKGDNETRYNNCLTWTDDKYAVFLTCRVSNFVSPVTFLHEKSQTKVDCYIHGKEHYCTPKGKNITFDQYDSSITIVLAEKKLDRDLDGRWNCIQGESSKPTEVSLSKGIIISSWVQIRGATVLINGSKFIKIDCSSCRRPKYLHAEFILNNETVASLWQTKHGDCRYGNINCSSTNKCSCSQIGNMFSFSIQAKRVNIATKLSCHMQFKDRFRSGTFSTTASHSYTGKDFAIMEFKTDVIKEGTQTIDSAKQITSLVDTGIQVPTKSSSTAYTIQSEKPPYTGSGEKLEPEIETVIAVALTFVVCLTIFVLCWYRKHKSIGEGMDDESLEPMLPKNCVICSKRRTAQKPRHMCFDCRQFFCSKCLTMFHSTNEELLQHKTVEMEKIPEQFSFEVFNCDMPEHNKAIIQYICHYHNKLCCSKCRKNSHMAGECKTEMITEILPKHRNEIISDHQWDLDVIEEDLIILNHYIKRLVDSFKRDLALLKQEIESSNAAKFQIQENDVVTGGLSRNDLEKKLNEFESGTKVETDQVKEIVDQFHEKVRKQKNMFGFILESGGDCHRIILAKSFHRILDDITLWINETKCPRKSININLKHEYGTCKVEISKEPVSSARTLKHVLYKSKELTSSNRNILNIKCETAGQATNIGRKTECHQSNTMAQVISPTKGIRKDNGIELTANQKPTI